MMSKRSFHSQKVVRRRVRHLSKNCRRTKVTRGLVAWRFLKGVVFISCLSFFAFQSTTFLLAYKKYPTTIKIEFTYPDELELPAITFCNRNPVKRSKFCAEYPDLCERPENMTAVCAVNPSLCKENPSNLVIPKIGFLTNDSYYEIIQTIPKIYYNGNVTAEFWEDWTWHIKTRRSKKLKPVFAVSPYKFYPCYTENLLLNSTDELMKISLGARYKRRRPHHYDLYTERSEEVIFPRKPSFLLSIHSPFVPVNPSIQGNVLEWGYNYKIYIRLGKVELQSYPYDTDCIDYEKLWSEKGKQGPRSQEMCKELCLYDIFEPYKNMTPEFEMLEYPLELCFGWRCQTSQEDSEILERCRKNCKPSCRNLKYTHTMVEIASEISQKEFPDSESAKERIEVDIFYRDRQVIVENHVPEYRIGYLFSYIGGLMGCWLGVSVWAFPRIAENILRRVLPWIEPMKRYGATISPAQPTIFSTHRNKVRRIKI